MIKLNVFGGYLLLAALIIISSCSKDDDSDNNNNANTNPPTEELTAESDPQVHMVIDGETIVQVGRNSFSSGHLLNADSSDWSWGFAIMDETLSVNYFSMDKGYLQGQTGWYADDQTFNDYFTPGPQVFTMDHQDTDGVILRHEDEDGVYWNTSWGTGDQAESSFVITEVIEYTELNGDAAVKIKAEFNCTFYNEAGESKTATNGVVVGRIRNM